MALSRRIIALRIADRLVAGEPVERVALQLAAYMHEARMTKQLDQMLGDITYELSRRGISEVAVTTARPLGEDLRQYVREFVANREYTDEVTIRESVDESIIGGIIIDAPSWRYDASIASQIKKLRTS